MSRMLFGLCSVLLLIVLTGVPSDAQPIPSSDIGDATAQMVTQPEQLTREIVNALVSRLSEQEVRALLTERLDRSETPENATVGSTTGQLIALFAEAVRRISDTAAFNSTHAMAFLYAESAVFGQFFDGLEQFGMPHVLRAVLLALGAGILAELAVHRLAFARRPERADPEGPDGFVEALRRAWFRLCRELFGALIFAFTVAVALHLMKLEGGAALVPVLMFWLVFVPRFGISVLRFLFVPGEGGTRLLSVDDATARFLFWNFAAMICAVGVTVSIAKLNTSFGGPPDALAGAFRFWLNVVFFGWLLFIFIYARDGWRSIMRARRDTLSPVEAWSVRVYPWAGVIAILATWAFCVTVNVMGMSGLVAGERHFISLVIVLTAPLLDTLIHAIVRDIMPPMRGEGTVAQDAYAASLRAYVRMGRVLVFGTVLLASARLWHITPLGMASAGIGEQLATKAVQVSLIVVVGYLAWEISRLLINIRLADELPDVGADHAFEDEEGHIAIPTTRLGTILPPISKAVQAIILSVTLLMVLGNLGVDVTALLAGAGIIGIAIGFGSQKLVSDVISGVFFMIDDAFRLNEYVDVGGPVGTVERISLRSIRLRDAKGPVLIIPYNEIKTVTNFGRDWGIMKMRFTVTFDTNVEQVRKIFKQIGQEMLADPVLGPGFITPFKSQGVYEFNEYGIVVRGKFTHTPGTQFGIRKRVFTRVKEEFEKANIQFARREVKVYVAGGGEISETQTDLIGAAAAESLAATDREVAARRTEG